MWIPHTNVISGHWNRNIWPTRTSAVIGFTLEIQFGKGKKKRVGPCRPALHRMNVIFSHQRHMFHFVINLKYHVLERQKNLHAYIDVVKYLHPSKFEFIFHLWNPGYTQITEDQLTFVQIKIRQMSSHLSISPHCQTFFFPSALYPFTRACMGK